MDNPYEKFKTTTTQLEKNTNVESLKKQEVIGAETSPELYPELYPEVAPEVNPYAQFKVGEPAPPAPEVNPYAQFKIEDESVLEPPEGEIELNVTDPEVVYNPILENKEDLKPEDVSTNKAVAHGVIKRDIIGGLKNKFSKEKLLNFMLQPMGQHLIENAINISSDSLMERVGIGEQFNLDPTVKYPPHVLKLVELAGGDINKMQDRLAMGMFLDGLACKGFNRLKLALEGKSGQVIGGNLLRLSRMTDDTLDATNRLIIKASGEVDDVTRTTEKIADAIFDTRAVGKVPDATLSTKSALMSSNDQIIGGIIMNNGTNSAAKVIKQGATRINKLNKLVANSKILNNPDKIIKPGETLKDILPTPGNKDITYLNRGGFAWFRSPQNYAPNVYEKILLLEQRQAQIKTGFDELLKPILKLEGTRQAKFVGAIVDNQPVAKEILDKGLLNDDGINALCAWKKISKSAADLRQLPEEKRISSYLTRIWDNARDSSIPASKDIKLIVSSKSKFEKLRTGGTGYNLDIAKAARAYVYDTAKIVAKRDFHGSILAAVNDIKKIDRTRGNIADIYRLNYFGETKKAYPHIAHTVSRKIKGSFASSTIGWNLGTGMLNLTQGPIFGASKIGYAAYARGVKMFGIMESKGGLKFKKLLRESGIFEGGTIEELRTTHSFWEKGLEKLPGGKFIVKNQFKFMDWSEKINKGTIYLGAYDDIIRKMQFVASKTTKKSNRTRDFLKRLGIDPTGDVAEEAHKYARKAVADTQIDMGRAGQNMIANNPYLSVGWMYMSFPFKMAEYVLKTSATGLKHLGKAVISRQPEIALNSPELRSTMRLGINFLVLKQIENMSGVSLRRITGIDNLIPTLGPVVQVAYKGWEAVEALSVKDGPAAEKITRTILTLSGLPINSPAWKLRSIFKAAIDNKGVVGDWTIYNKRTGKPMYKVDPIQYMFGETLGFVEPKIEEEYHNLIQEQIKNYKTIRNLSNQISKSNQQLKTQKDNDALKARKKENQKEVRKLRRETKSNVRVLKGMVR